MLYMATRPRAFAIVLVYFIKHSVSCYIYYIQRCAQVVANCNTESLEIKPRKLGHRGS